MFITDDIRYVGVNDHNIDLFEGQYVVENGMAYNSYVIMDEQIAVMDTVDGNFTDEWLKNISDVIGDRKPSYLIVWNLTTLPTLPTFWIFTRMPKLSLQPRLL